jgi:hypothetical protein
MCGHDIRYAPYRQTVLFQGPLIFWTKDKKLTLCLFLIIQTLCHENTPGCAGIAPHYLMDSGGRGWSASRPGRFTVAEIAPGTHWIGGWLGHGEGVGAVKRRKILPLPGF